MSAFRLGFISFTSLVFVCGVLLVVFVGGLVIIPQFASYQKTNLVEQLPSEQSVPEDLEASTSSSIAELLLEASSTSPNESSLAQQPATSSLAPKPTSLVQVPKPTTTQSIPVVLPNPIVALPPVRTINPETIVGLVCYFNRTATNESTQEKIDIGGVQVFKGSGVIIHQDGHILTNRHVVESPEVEHRTIPQSDGSSVNISVAYKFAYCDVGLVPKGSSVPTPADIKALNPHMQIPVLGYRATILHIPSIAGLSAEEAFRADFAILKIVGVSDDGPTFGVTSVPTSFPYAELLPTTNVKIGDDVVTYGFPGDITVAKGDSFQTLYFTGSVGTITGVERGDLYYRGVPLTLAMNLDVSGGRSGSPLFWRGYVIGLIWAHDDANRLDSYSVASDVILKDGYY